MPNVLRCLFIALILSVPVGVGMACTNDSPEKIKPAAARKAAPNADQFGFVLLLAPDTYQVVFVADAKVENHTGTDGWPGLWKHLSAFLEKYPDADIQLTKTYATQNATGYCKAEFYMASKAGLTKLLRNDKTVPVEIQEAESANTSKALQRLQYIYQNGTQAHREAIHSLRIEAIPLP
jgi:hypothetical protein